MPQCQLTGAGHTVLAFRTACFQYVNVCLRYALCTVGPEQVHHGNAIYSTENSKNKLYVRILYLTLNRYVRQLGELIIYSFIYLFTYLFTYL